MTRKEAKQFIEALLKIRNGVTDELAVKAKGIYPSWEKLRDAKYTFKEEDITNEFRFKYGEYLYKVRKVHTVQADWTPDRTPDLYIVVNESNKGTPDDPIPAVAGMVYEKDLYYVYNDVIYLCIREDTEGGTVLHYTPDALVGVYFEVAAL